MFCADDLCIYTTFPIRNCHAFPTDGIHFSPFLSIFFYRAPLSWLFLIFFIINYVLRYGFCYRRTTYLNTITGIKIIKDLCCISTIYCCISTIQNSFLVRNGSAYGLWKMKLKKSFNIKRFSWSLISNPYFFTTFKLAVTRFIILWNISLLLNLLGISLYTSLLSEMSVTMKEILHSNNFFSKSY